MVLSELVILFCPFVQIVNGSGLNVVQLPDYFEVSYSCVQFISLYLVNSRSLNLPVRWTLSTGKKSK